MAKRPRTLETPLNSIQIQDHDHLSGYEQTREQRIKENLERMQKLGIFDLSLKLKSLNPSKHRNASSNRKTTPRRVSPLPPSGPARRSSRLQNATPVSYCEVPLTKKGTDLEQELIRDGSKPEIYTEEHEKQLGDTKMPWTLFVDGYGNDGKRIYDPVRGKSCHQCRQKTLGHRTSCCKCNMVQGQFCGDCLFMRYGENVLEAKRNPDWICPVCRGICNCSLCRQAKGWPPTGTMYKKISNLGFKSVAHYLIQTRRANAADSENILTSNKTPKSAKRSLPFTDTVENLQGLENLKSEDNKSNHDVMISSEEDVISISKPQDKNTKEEIIQIVANDQCKDDDKVNLEHINGVISICEPQDKNTKEEIIQIVANDQCEDDDKVNLEHINDVISICEPQDKNTKEETIQVVGNEQCEDEDKVIVEHINGVISISEPQAKNEKEETVKVVDNEQCETSVKSKRKRRLASEPTVDSIGGRLRMRRSKECRN